MSFHFNLSSSEDEDDFLAKDGGKIAAASTENVAERRDSQDDNRNHIRNSNDSDEESDQVDWEDATAHDDDDVDRKPPAFATKLIDTSALNAVTIDFTKRKKYKEERIENTIKKKKPSNVVRVESLDPSIQRLLWNLHNAHLLAMTSHAVFLSQLCSDVEVMAVAYSLIPEPFHSYSSPLVGPPQNGKTHSPSPFGPSLSQIQSFLEEWYFDFVRGTLPQKRPAALRKKRPKTYVEIALEDEKDSDSDYGARSIKKSNSAVSSVIPAVSNGDSARDARRERREQLKNESHTITPMKEDSESDQEEEVQPSRRPARLKRAASASMSIDKKNGENASEKPNATRKKARRKDPSIGTTENNCNTQSEILDCTDEVNGGGRQPKTKRNAEKLLQSRSQIWNDVQFGKECLLSFTSFLAGINVQGPHFSLFSDDPMDDVRKSQLYTVILIAMLRSMGWRARLVVAIEPLLPDITADHPLLISFFNAIISSVVSKKRSSSAPVCNRSSSACGRIAPSDGKILLWVEILCSDPKSKNGHRWVHIDPLHQLIDQPDQLEHLVAGRSPKVEMKVTSKRGVLAYALGVEHCIIETNEMNEDSTRMRLTDVTPRYALSWVSSLRKRRTVRTKNCSIEENVKNSWWSKTLHVINDKYRPSRTAIQNAEILGPKGTKEKPIRLDKKTKKKRKPAKVSLEPSHFDKLDELEAGELVALANNEALPTSKGAFRTHPTYVIPSELGKAEVLAPDADKRSCGSFKDQIVYRRSDVSTAFTATKWLYDGRKVRDEELSKPVKVRQKRKKPIRKGFKALESYGVGDTNDGNEERQILQGSKPLEDETENLYGIWQTDEWSPEYIGPDDEIPMNDYKNVELAFLNPGLVHIDERGLAMVAKKLGIPYAPCVIGFEGHGPYRAPTIRGIVVHEHNEQVVREAGAERRRLERERAEAERRRSILLLWKRLMVGLLTKERLDREYGANSE